MKDIGVYTKMKTLKHKIKISRRKDVYPFWIIPFGKWLSMEEQIEGEAKEATTDSLTSSYGEMSVLDFIPERIWFASNGSWQGYFDIKDIRGNDVHMGKWHPIHPRKPFRGFTYKVPTNLTEELT